MTFRAGMLQGRRYGALAGSNSATFIEGRRLNHLTRVSSTDTLATYTLGLLRFGGSPAVCVNPALIRLAA